MFLGKFEVFGEGVEEGEERFCVLSVSARSVNEVGVGMRGVRT